MKKIINFIFLFLFIVCLLPTVVDAKANFKFEKEFENEMFLYEKDGKYYFINLNSSSEEENLKSYDSNNNFIEYNNLYKDDYETLGELYKYEPFYEYIKLVVRVEEKGEVFKSNNMLYAIYYYDEAINIINLDDDSTSEVLFSDDEEFTKSILGNSYDIYKIFKSLNYSVNLIRQSGNVFIVDYYDENDIPYLAAVDKDGKIILKVEYSEDSYYIVEAFDDLIYVMTSSDTIDIYKMDGSKYQTFNITNTIMNQYNEDSFCENYAPFTFNIKNNKMFITYRLNSSSCERRLNLNDATDFAKQVIAEPNFLTLEYELDFDVDAVSSSNGEFTYETKEDEDGKSYVELKITPKDGYSVEDIIVTDIYGNRIEVTNNKFYKPLNDVKIEVKYINGEYLPIPNTALSQSITVIIIGVILVGLGFYTINYVRSEEK